MTIKRAYPSHGVVRRVIDAVHYLSPALALVSDDIAEEMFSGGLTFAGAEVTVCDVVFPATGLEA